MQMTTPPPAPSAPAPDDSDISRQVRIGLLVLGAFVATLVAWSLLADISGAVVAQGVIIPDGKRKTIQHQGGGTVTAIHVREGDRVQAGQVLLQLDEVQLQATYNVVLNQYNAALAQEARLLAEQQGLDSMPDPFSTGDLKGRAALEQEIRVFNTRQATFQGELSILRDRMRQLEQEITGHQNLRSANDRQLKLINQELEGLRELAGKGYTPRNKVLEVERRSAAIEGDIGYRTSEIARAHQRMAETRNEMAQVQKRRDDEVSRDLRQIQVSINDLEPKLVAAREALRHAAITAPVEGYVINLAMVTIGGVVEPGKPIMDLIPVDGGAVAEVQISPRDIDDMRLGLEGEIHLSGYSAVAADPMHATVAVVSADRNVDPRTGESFYMAQLRIPAPEIAKLSPIRVIPGMPVEAVVPTQARTLFGYIADPLRQRFRRALRER
jgi:HlyD family type I secretion membrane fusion protein